MSDVTASEDAPDLADESRPRPSRSDAAWILGTYFVLGVAGAVLWWLLADPAYFTKGKNGLGMGEVQLGRRFNADGWYAVIAIVLGLLSGAALVWRHSRDHLVTAGLILAGSVLAAFVMSALGTWLGPADPESVVAAAPIGAQIPTRVEVTAPVNYLVWPIAVLVGMLTVLWSPPSDTDR